jgi:hypothetical protein
MSQNLIFIDSNVRNTAPLLSDLPANSEVHYLAANQDGLKQIAAVLHHRHDIAAIHLIAHGNSGALALGSTVLTSDNVSDYTSTLRRIGDALTPQGDLLLYGCNVAQGVAGE